MDRLTDWSRQTQTQTHRDADTDTQRHTHTQRQTDRRTDGRRDGRTDRQGENRLYATVLKAPKPRFGFQGFDKCFFTLNPVVMILLIQHLARRVMLPQLRSDNDNELSVGKDHETKPQSFPAHSSAAAHYPLVSFLNHGTFSDSGVNVNLKSDAGPCSNIP